MIKNSMYVFMYVCIEIYIYVLQYLYTNNFSLHCFVVRRVYTDIHAPMNFTGMKRIMYTFLYTWMRLTHCYLIFICVYIYVLYSELKYMYPSYVCIQE